MLQAVPIEVWLSPAREDLHHSGKYAGDEEEVAGAGAREGAGKGAGEGAGNAEEEEEEEDEAA